jgi:predicted O-methyltransferase YrrM
MSLSKILLPRLHMVHHYPDLFLYFLRDRAMITKKLVEKHLSSVQSNWNPKYYELEPLQVFRNAILKNLVKYVENKYLYHIVRYLEPRVVIETGVHYGISTAFILQAINDNKKGILISIDLPNKEYKTDFETITQILPRGRETGFVVPDKLRENWTLQIGDAKDYLETYCEKEAPIDLFHHDSEHTYNQMMFEFKTVWPYLKKGGMIVCDDADTNEALITFGIEKMLNKQGVFTICKGRGCILKT